ncbi:winged helix-turn-helix transcriptional regulator [bacterium]|nr:winged helix-turn-helix transcriptional regulator [bacterium]
MPEKSPYEADFEKYLRYTGADKKEKTFAWSTAIGLQQIHAFGEGNTLVRANYTNLQKGISENPVFLEKFFRNLLLDEHNELKNRETHIDYAKYTGKVSEETTVEINENFGAKENSSVETAENFGINEKTSVQILELIKNNPRITLQEIAEKTNRSKRAIEMQVKKLRENGVLKHVGATKNGYWEIVEEK